MKNTRAVVIPLIAAAAIVAGCGGTKAESGTDGAAATTSKKLVIGYVNSVGEEGYPSCAIDGMRDEATKLGHELRVVSTAYDAEKEVTNAQALAGQGVDVIINWPVAPATGKRVAQIAKQANVPYFPFFAANEAPEGDLLGALFWDSYGFGKALGDWIKKERPKAVILELDGSNADSGSNATKQGIADGIEGSPVKIKQHAETNWSPDEAAKLALELLPANPDVTMVITQNDLMALAVLRSIKQLKLDHKVESLTNVTFTKQGQAAFEKGDLPFSAFDSAYANGQEAVKSAVALLGDASGERVRKIGPIVDTESLPPLC